MPTRILGNIYISSFEPIQNVIDLKGEFGITHVLSVVSNPLPPHLLQEYLHLHIDITDEPTSNLLETLEEAKTFMDHALVSGSTATEGPSKHKGAVLVHCAQGESRSVAVVVAYLMYKHNLAYKQAFHAVKRKLPNAEPNEGFVKQLQLFGKMGCKVEPTHSLYKAYLVETCLKLDPSGRSLQQLGFWRKKNETKSLEETEEAGTKADGNGAKENEAKENEANDLQNSETDVTPYNLRCKRCRNVLARNGDIEHHDKPDSESRQAHFVRTVPNRRRIISSVEGSNTCSHYFLSEPVVWMEEELSKQEMDGKLACPKCDAKVGGYSWKGSRCSCGKWMIPALHLQSAKIDLMKS